MKPIAVAVVASAAFLATTSASAKLVPVQFASRTIVCRTPDILFAFDIPARNISVTTAGSPLLSAGLGGALVETRCRALRLRTLPKPVLPPGSYASSFGGDAGDCTTPGTVVLHFHYLRSRGRVNGIYVSARRRNGRFIAAALLTRRGTVRAFYGSTCVAR
jgi:hypothetical protein